MSTQKRFSWLERLEDLIHVLEGSSISELELTEAGTEIIIRRQPGMVMVPDPQSRAGSNSVGMPASSAGSAIRSDGVAILAPLTGVYYSASTPSSPPFANVGDIVQAGQTVALIESMKIFHEVQAEVSGRVVAIPVKSGEVVQKSDVLMRIQPS
jgi:acetyl-CoA carboxylase biotin carboxyl carrier protein